MRHHTVLLPFAVLALILPASCDWGDSRIRHECEPDAFKCEDNTAYNCQVDKDDVRETRWSSGSCGMKHCIAQGRAFCALSPQPDPGCRDQGICDGRKLVDCSWEGYRVQETVCPVACFPGCDGGPPFCVRGTAPDPLCADTNRACEGNVSVDCRCGYRTGQYDCATQEMRCLDQAACGDDAVCRECVGKHGVCADPVKNPVCPPSEGSAEACDGDTIIDCRCGFRTGVERRCGDRQMRCTTQAYVDGGHEYIDCR